MLTHTEKRYELDLAHELSTMCSSNLVLSINLKEHLKDKTWAKSYQQGS